MLQTCHWQPKNFLFPKYLVFSIEMQRQTLAWIGISITLMVSNSEAHTCRKNFTYVNSRLMFRWHRPPGKQSTLVYGKSTWLYSFSAYNMCQKFFKHTELVLTQETQKVYDSVKICLVNAKYLVLVQHHQHLHSARMQASYMIEVLAFLQPETFGPQYNDNSCLRVSADMLWKRFCCVLAMT